MKKKFAKSVGVLIGGTAGAQLIVVLASPILTRLYSPVDFGVLAIYISLLSLISVVAALRYDMAIPLPLEKSEATLIVILSLILVGLVTAISLCFVVIWREEIAIILGEPKLSNYLWFLPLSVLFAGIYSIFTYWSIRVQQFSRVAKTRMSQSIVGVFIQLLGYRYGGINLVFSHAASQSVGIFSLARGFFSQLNNQEITLKKIKSVAKKYRRFPIYSTWEALLNAAGTQMPPLLFGVLFSPAAAGLYSLANRVLSLPMTLIGAAVGQVFFAGAAEAYREGRLGALVAQLHAKLAHLGMAPALFLILLGPELFVLIFGKEWRQAGIFAQWMVPWLYLVFVSSPLSTLFAVMERQGQSLTFQIILLIARLFAIWLGVLLHDITAAVIFFSTVSAFCWLGFLFWMGIATGNKLSVILMPTLHAMAFALLSSLPIILSLYLFRNHQGFWVYGLTGSLLLFILRSVLFLRKA